MSEPLKPCPFCGSEDVVMEDVEDFFGRHYFVKCYDCFCEGPPQKEEQRTIWRWNERAEAKND